ncbi:hypothetical protein HN018_22040 (plasmid) [Lichenicola cladoniae]|uniref:Uncharacterized protein n=1 Tax=Lichenicola cladoniae TaxID=1484109 RepID=A0A6M8HXT0_9PROT|nr:hypothetical protein [Lichenicola cladoniae]NPD69755.1 hypothetical protein [Acetobacteraceae bacterium]QKE92911.1 hypothetical protein HN018_22040 [Lichenicola cladoniae]
MGPAPELLFHYRLPSGSGRIGKAGKDSCRIEKLCRRRRVQWRYSETWGTALLLRVILSDHSRCTFATPALDHSPGLSQDLVCAVKEMGHLRFSPGMPGGMAAKLDRYLKQFVRGEGGESAFVHHR